MIPNWFYMSSSDSPDHLGSILYRSESSEVPYFTNQYQELFFAVTYSKPALSKYWNSCLINTYCVMIIIWIFLVLLPSFVHSKGWNEICFATSSKFLHDVRAEIPFSWEIWYSIELLSVTSVVELEGTRGSRIENKYGEDLRYLGNPGMTRQQERVRDVTTGKI